MRDICENKHGGDLFSLAAFDRIAERLPECRRRVLEVIRGAGRFGATCSEIAEALRRPMNAISGRITELKEAGLVVEDVENGRPRSRCGTNGNRGRVIVAK